jgi:hypothetical protein
VKKNNIQSNRLQQLELDIEMGLRTIGKALKEIHETKAYIEEYDTFEDYCKSRWSMTARHARNIIDAERVRCKIEPVVDVAPLRDAHLLELSKVPEKQQAQVAARVMERCEIEGRKPTKKDFTKEAEGVLDVEMGKKVPTEVLGETQKVATKKSAVPAYDDSDYEDVGEIDDYEDVEEKPELPPIKEQISKLRSVAIQHYQAAMRAVDDMNSLQRDKKHLDIVAAANVTIQDAVKGGWK